MRWWYLDIVVVVNLAVCRGTTGYHYSDPWPQGHDEDTHNVIRPHHDTILRILPRELMVDVINNLGLTLLEVHNQNNDNNIALSPYGATSVLVALAEGLVGDGARELIQSANIPGDLSAVRVGLRDIHRHLKSYFIPKEGFLAGLTLSNENVSLNQDYENILRFYGYDINSFNTVFYPETTTKSLESLPTSPPTTTSIPSSSSSTTTTVLSTTQQQEVVTTQTPSTIVTTTEKPEGRMSTEKGTTSIIGDEDSTETVQMITPERTTRKEEKTTIKSTSSNLVESKMEELDDKDELNTTPTVSSRTTTRRRKLTTRKRGSTIPELETTTFETTITPTITTEGFISTESMEDITRAETRFVPPSTFYTTVKMVETTTVKMLEATTEEIGTTTNLPTTEKEIETSSIPIATTTTTTTTTTTESPISTTILPEITTVEETTTTEIPKINSISTNPAITIEEITTTFIPPTLEDLIIATTTSASAINNVISTTNDDLLTTNIRGEEEVLTTTEMYPDVLPEDDIFLSTENFNSIATSTNGDTLDNQLYDNPVVDYSLSSDYLDPNLDYTRPETTTSFPISTTDSFQGSTITEEPTITEITPLFDPSSDFNITADLLAPITSNLTRRSTRSVVDYIIAKYYDNYDHGNRRQYYPRDRTHHHHQPFDYRPQAPLTFLVNGRVPEPNINFMTYDTILPFYYVPGLDAMALSFPLDSSKYYLLLVLPVEADGIDRLICNFKQETTLKGIIENLKYTHVKAVIPSFMLKGYVILTPTFQKIGIRKIFEPRQADFSQMTPEKDIYVTNIEQAITVTIRNYVDPTNLPNGKFRNYRPVDFIADHPFLFFVMDSEIHVSLMAGKVLNPLNTRIK